MFTGFKDRIEILSRGVLPPKQTIEGFYAGESVPVNEALSKIFINKILSVVIGGNPLPLGGGRSLVNS